MIEQVWEQKKKQKTERDEREIEEGACWATDGGDRKGEESLITENEGGHEGVRETHVGWFSGHKKHTRLTVMDCWLYFFLDYLIYNYFIALHVHFCIFTADSATSI